MALCVSFVCQKNLCVRLLGYIVGAFPPWENMCVCSLGYIVGASPPLCVCSIGNTVGVSNPHVCPFCGRQSSLDPCMLPTSLCGIFCKTAARFDWGLTLFSTRRTRASKSTRRICKRGMKFDTKMRKVKTWQQISKTVLFNHPWQYKCYIKCISPCCMCVF